MKHANHFNRILKPVAFCITAVAFVIAMQGCKKDNSSGSAAVSEDEAAEAITESVTTSSAGMAVQSSAATDVTSKYVAFLPCGLSFDSSISVSNEAGAAITFSYNLSWGWILQCNNNIPDHIDFSAQGHCVYDAPRMSSDDQANTEITVSDILNEKDEYSLTLNYVRNGTQQSKIGYKNSFSSTITITSTDIKVDKATNIISSGTATAVIAGQSSGGVSFSYTATLTFLGNKQGVLTMPSGQTYNIQWD